MDGNQNTGFGGIHPSQWTDGRYTANQLTDNWDYMRRLYTRKGYGSQYGATVCADNFMMHSSTSGLVCTAVFRIRNTGSRSVRWNIPLTVTSFSGWSEYASVSINGARNWVADCHHTCRSTVAIDVPGNSAGDRISTVVFVATSNYPYSQYNWQERATILMFRDNSLRLPTGLEYVDDFDTLSGRWKV